MCCLVAATLAGQLRLDPSRALWGDSEQGKTEFIDPNCFDVEERARQWISRCCLGNMDRTLNIKRIYGIHNVFRLE